MGWTEEIVAELARLKRAGVKRFEVAWSYAIDEFPPRGMVGGPKYRRLDDELPLAVFLEERCRLEWEGKATQDYALGLRALMDAGHEDVGVVRLAVHSHRRAA